MDSPIDAYHKTAARYIWEDIEESATDIFLAHPNYIWTWENFHVKVTSGRESG